MGSVGGMTPPPSVAPMARAVVDKRFQRALLSAGTIVGSLAAVGIVMTLAAHEGSVWRDLGLAVLGGAIVGGALVTVESLLAGAAEERSDYVTLLNQLSTTIDLNGIDLSGRELSSIYLPGRALVAAQLSRTLFDDSKLLFSDLRHADLSDASLRGTDLSGSTVAFGNLRGAKMSNVSFRDADLSDASLDGADLSGATVVDARLRRTSLVGANLTGATFKRCFLEGADFTSANTTGTTFEANQYDPTTRWPISLQEVPENVVVTQQAISEMDLATYLAWRATAGPTPP